MEKLKMEFDLSQAQRLRSLVYLSANLASKLSNLLPKLPTDKQAEIKNLSVELARAGAGDKKEFAPLMQVLNKYIGEQSKVESQNRKQETEKRKAENLSKRIETLKKQISDVEAKVKNPPKGADVDKLSSRLKELKEALTKATKAQKEVKTTTTNTQPNGIAGTQKN